MQSTFSEQLSAFLFFFGHGFEQNQYLSKLPATVYAYAATVKNWNYSQGSAENVGVLLD